MLIGYAPWRARMFRVMTPFSVICIGVAVIIGRVGVLLPWADFWQGFMQGLLLGLGTTAATAGFIHTLKEESR